MMPARPLIPLSLPIALQRQVARTSRRALALPSPSPASASRTSTSALHTSVRALGPKRPIPPPNFANQHSSPALAALLSRLSLPPTPALQSSLQACLTHPSFVQGEGAGAGAGAGTTETNELLASLGNSLLGLFASEHLASRYPLLPTAALQSAVTAYVGSDACLSIGRALGVAVSPPNAERASAREAHLTRRAKWGVGERIKKYERHVEAGVPVRWDREVLESEAKRAADEGLMGELPLARRFRKYAKGGAKAEVDEAEEAEGWAVKREKWDDVVAGCIKAFVGLIYQEQGMDAARLFTRAHFFSRHLDMTSLFHFRNPKHVLARTIAQHLESAGVRESEGMAKIESRILAESGRFSQAPLFSIGLFLPSGVKLAEGHGASISMAEHRAAVNALHAVYLVRGDQADGVDVLGWQGEGKREGEGEGRAQAQLPTEAHGTWALEAGRVGRGSGFVGRAIGGVEVVEESARR